VDEAWERAVTRGDVEAVRQLLRSGADVNARDRYGQTALMLAAHHGHRELAETLVRSGADLNATAKYNLSAIMLSIVTGHAAIARLLARAGADLRLRGSGAPGFAGKTARDLAVAREMEELYADLEPRRAGPARRLRGALGGFEKPEGAGLKILCYVLVVILGAIGALSVIRVVERLIYGGGAGSWWVQLLIGVLCLFGAWHFLKRARSM
jgi:hypothetical protein